MIVTTALGLTLPVLKLKFHLFDLSWIVVDLLSYDIANESKRVGFEL